MKLKKLLTKSLLVAAGLLTGANAWAEATVIYERGTTGKEWSADDVANSGTNVWIGNFGYNETYGLYASANGGRSSVLTFSHTDNSLQTFDIVFNNLGNTGDAGNYSYLKIGSDIEIQSNQQNQNGAVIINGISKAISDCNQKNYNRGGDSWTIHVEINTAKNTVTALTIVGTTMNGKSAHFTLTEETALSANATYNTATIGFIRVKGTPSAALTSIKIAEEAQSVSVANFTINYIFGEETIKTVNGTSVVGAGINAETPITIEGQKYFAVDGATTSMELTATASENVLNVNLRQAATYAYTVNAVDGSNNILKQITAGSNVEGDAVAAFGYPQYLKVGDVLYKSTQSLTSGGYYKYSGYTPTADNAVLNITYTASDINALWFSEAEDIDGASANSANNTDIRCSMAAGAQFGSATNVVTLPAGTYTLHAQIWGNQGTNFTFMAGASQIGEETTFSTNGNLHTNSAEFTLTESTTITVLGGANGKVIDWIYITGTPSTDTEIIGAIDFSTAFMGDYKSMTIKEGETIAIEFKNHGNGEKTWNNWLVRLSGAEGVNHTLRADNYVIGDADSNVSTRSIEENDGDINLDDFTADMANATVNMTIVYGLDGMFSIEATATGGNNTYKHTFAYNDAKSGEITVELGVEKAWLEILSFTKQAITVTAKVGSRGMATFSSTYALDFTNVTDVTAYVVTGEEGNMIVRKPITGKVAANTGLVLKSTNGGAVTVEIPAATEGTEYNNTTTTKNYLVAVSEDTEVVKATTGTNYVLSVQGGKVVFAPIEDVSATVTAGKAYLAMPEGSNARMLYFDEGEATAIQAVESLTEQGQEVYNLQGQRVSQPTKGLYIVNGKKVIKK